MKTDHTDHYDEVTVVQWYWWSTYHNFIEKIRVYQLQSEDCLVSVGKVSVHGHDHAVGDDGQDDAVLEWPAVD